MSDETVLLVLDGPDVAPRVRCCGCTGGPTCAACAARGSGCACHTAAVALQREPSDDEIRAQEAAYVAARSRWAAG